MRALARALANHPRRTMLSVERSHLRRFAPAQPTAGDVDHHLASLVRGRTWTRQVAAGRAVLAAATLALWRLAADIAGPLYLAAPSAVAERIIDTVSSGAILPHVSATFRVSALGFAAGALAGVVLPLLLYPFPRLTRVVEPIVVASAGIPKYAAVPLLILWLGIDDGPKLWLVGLLVFYPMFIAVLTGARNIDRRPVDMARVLGAGDLAVARFIVWPALLPFVFAALRIAVPRAVSAAIVGEFLVGSVGVGYLIESSRQTFDIVGVFAGVVIATALVVAPAAIVRRLERRVFAWRPNEAPVAI